MRKRRPRFVKPSNEGTSWYDIIGDWELIEASFAQQYGIRLRREEDMTWGEFSTLLAGIDSESPLGRIVSIRSENDKEKLKKFSPEERRIRNEWRAKNRRVNTSEEERDKALAGFQAMFKSLAMEGGVE